MWMITVLCLHYKQYVTTLTAKISGGNLEKFNKNKTSNKNTFKIIITFVLIICMIELKEKLPVGFHLWALLFYQHRYYSWSFNPKLVLYNFKIKDMGIRPTADPF